MRILPLLLFALPALAEPGEHLGKSLAEWQAWLGSEDRQERLLAARAVGEMAIADAAGAETALLGALNHSDSAVRYWAVIAFGEMGERAGVGRERLRRLLDDPAPEVRVWAAYALHRLGEEQSAINTLIEELSNPEKGARLQAAHALDALGKAAAPAAEALRGALDDDFDYVRRVARHALWTLGERPCPYEDCN